MRVTVCSTHFFHSVLSNAKNGSDFPLVTGGSWKKSPVMTNCGVRASTLHHSAADKSRNRPVSRQMAFPYSFVDFGQSTTTYRTSGHPPWKLYFGSPIVRWNRALSHSPSSMTNTFVVFHRFSAGLHVLMHFICLSRSIWPGVTAPQEWIVIPTEQNSPSQEADPYEVADAVKGNEQTRERHTADV